jgi:hypothetical protein
MEADFVEGTVEHCCIQARGINFFLKLVLIFGTHNICIFGSSAILIPSKITSQKSEIFCGYSN